MSFVVKRWTNCSCFDVDLQMTLHTARSEKVNVRCLSTLSNDYCHDKPGCLLERTMSRSTVSNRSPAGLHGEPMMNSPLSFSPTKISFVPICTETGEFEARNRACTRCLPSAGFGMLALSTRLRKVIVSSFHWIRFMSKSHYSRLTCARGTAGKTKRRNLFVNASPCSSLVQ